MTERYTQEMHEEYRRQQDEAAAKVERERRERLEKEGARKTWIRDGGRAEDFEAAWPGLRDEGRKKRAAEADRSARQAQARISTI